MVAGAVGISPAIAEAQPAGNKAQPAGKMWRIGFLTSGSSATSESRLVSLEQGLRDLGYTPGADIFIERRYADGHAERLPRLAAELVRLGAGRRRANPVDVVLPAEAGTTKSR